MHFEQQDLSQEALSPLATVTDYLRFTYAAFNGSELYYGHGTDNAWDEAVHLVLGVLNLPWDVDKNLLQGVLTSAERLALGNALRARILDRVPTAYLIGQAWFMDLPFKINRQALIPRSPIAELLREELQPWVEEPPGKILDLCCGSGCIGIAAAYVFPDARVVLSDISDAALELAQANIEQHQLADRVSATKSDVFESLSGSFDVILSNPPYVDARDMQDLPPEYLHEPRLGLASGEDGLDLTRQILALASNMLNDGGVLICEVGNSIEALFQQFPEVMFLCPEFEQGGHGVFVLNKQQLIEHQQLFENVLVARK